MQGSGSVGRRRADAGFRQPVFAQQVQGFNPEAQQVPFGDLLHLFAQRRIVQQLLDSDSGLMNMQLDAAQRLLPQAQMGNVVERDDQRGKGRLENIQRFKSGGIVRIQPGLLGDDRLSPSSAC